VSVAQNHSRLAMPCVKINGKTPVSNIEQSDLESGQFDFFTK
jgi:hypothetical protein